MEKTDYMPIIGLDKTLFGKLNYSDFIFQDEFGHESCYTIKDYLILSVHPHYFSANLTPEDKQIIIVNSNNKILVGSDYKNIHDLNNLCGPCFITSYENAVNHKGGAFLFHPLQYFTTANCVYCLYNMDGRLKFCPDLYYICSYHGVHFFYKKDLSLGQKERCKDTFCLVLDNHGEIIHKCTEENLLRTIWCRTDGSLSLICTGESSNYKNIKLTLISIDKEYNGLSYQKYLQKLNEGSDGFANEVLSFVNKDYHTSDLIEEYAYKEFMSNKYILKRELEIKSELFIGLSYKTEENIVDYKYQQYTLSYSCELACDDERMVIPHGTHYGDRELGYMIISPENKLKHIDCGHLFPGYSMDDELKQVRTGNGFVCFYVSHKAFEYDTYYDEYGDRVDRVIGSYYEPHTNYNILDLEGNLLGELSKDNILKTHISKSNIQPQYGVMLRRSLEIIIPPIYNSIECLQNYKEYLDNEDSANIEYLYVDEYDRKVKADITLYITNLSLPGGRTLSALYKNEEEIIPLGENNMIKKISDQHIIAKTKNDEHHLGKLYYYDGTLIATEVIDAENINIYDIIDNSLVTTPFSFTKVYVQDGFKILRGKTFAIDYLFTEFDYFCNTFNDVIFKGKMLDGSVCLISLKNGILLDKWQGKTITNIEGFRLLFDTEYAMGFPDSLSKLILSGIAFTYDDMYKLREAIKRSYIINSQAYLHQYNNKYFITSREKLNLISVSNNHRKIDSDATLIKRASLFFENQINREDEYAKVTLDNEEVGFYSVHSGWGIEPETCVSLETCFGYYVDDMWVDRHILYNQKYRINSHNITVIQNDGKLI